MSTHRYARVARSNVAIELGPEEWAVVLDALERVQADRDNGYDITSRQALSRAVRKVDEGREQIAAYHAEQRARANGTARAAG